MDTPSLSALPELQHYELSPLADGVIVALAKEDGAAFANSGIIDLGGCTLVFDSGMTPQAGQELRQAAKTLTGREADYVINSHWHYDHVLGNQSFAPETVILATGWTRERLASGSAEELNQTLEEIVIERQVFLERLPHETDPLAQQDLRFALAYMEGALAARSDYRLRLPERIVGERETLEGSRRAAQLLTFGAGHSGSDLVLHLPAEGIVFAGDLLAVERHPWLGEADLDNWRATLRKLADLKPKAIAPGHGGVGKTYHLREMYHYLTTIEEMVRELVECAATEDEAATSPVPKPYRGWRWEVLAYRQSLRALFTRMAEEMGP